MTRYCICRSEDSDGFMICCEKCDEWFHGKCIKIKKKAADNIDKYYCNVCSNRYNIEIVYKNKPPVSVSKPKTPVDEKPFSTIVKQEQLETISIPRISSSCTIPAPAPTRIPAPVSLPAPPIPRKSPKKPAGKKRELKAKTRGSNAKQCANPECVNAARSSPKSKYCSEECGLEFNKKRYELFYKPNWKALSENHSKARLNRMKDMENLEKEKVEVEELIKNLKEEKREVEQIVKKIKEDAQEMSGKRKLVEDSDESSSKNEDVEEYLTGDSAKTFCITCGHTIIKHQAFKHWLTCHKKNEMEYNLTGLAKTIYENDDDPEIFCDVIDKKSKRFCKHLASACPLHTNFVGNKDNKDEVCGCPLEIMQKLVADGNYCLELKKDCTMHYHWDKFRIAEINLLRLQAYSRLDIIAERIRNLRMHLSDTYGGLVGVMLHKTRDHQDAESPAENFEEDESVAVDV